jgi:hypothetical protein
MLEFLRAGRRNGSTLISKPGLMGAAAGLAYLLDPERGRDRRAKLRDKVARATRESRESAEKIGRDLRNRTVGLLAEIRSSLDTTPASDEVQEARVRSEMGRVVARPGRIQVQARSGHVTLTGSVPLAEHRDLVSAVRSTRGVVTVEDRLEVHDGDQPIEGRRRELSPGRWSPSTRFVVGGAGALLALSAIRQLGLKRAGVLVSGFVLFLRASSRR